MTGIARSERYSSNQKKRGMERVQIWLPTADVARFKKLGEKAREKHLKAVEVSSND